jgi:Anti-sigma-28 factor, FlgM
LPLFPAAEEISICDALARLCPALDQGEILQRLRENAARRRERVDELRRQVLAGTYHVSPRAVATAILLEGDLPVR